MMTHEDYEAANEAENLEEERRRLARRIGQALVDNQLVLALQWIEMLVSLELRSGAVPPLLVLPLELSVRLLVLSISAAAELLNSVRRAKV
jgi:hypothetical protein